MVFRLSKSPPRLPSRVYFDPISVWSEWFETLYSESNSPYTIQIDEVIISKRSATRFSSKIQKSLTVQRGTSRKWTTSSPNRRTISPHKEMGETKKALSFLGATTIWAEELERGLHGNEKRREPGTWDRDVGHSLNNRRFRFKIRIVNILS